MSDVLLSVICTTYGHEKYIRKALDSILMQKIDFSMEVLIGEDCSPDNSRAILKEYEKRYPGFFTVIYREKNIGAPKNSIDLRNRAKGKYLAFLELDDYWIDCHKLQKQVDFLEAHNDVVAVASKYIIVDKYGQPTGMECNPGCRKEYYNWEDYFNNFMPGQTASIICRNIFTEKGLARELGDDYRLFPGDRKSAFIYLCYGKIYCMQEEMSAYRYVWDEGYSYTASIQKRSKTDYYKQYVLLYKGILRHAEKYGSKKIIIKAEIMYSLTKYGLYREEKNGKYSLKCFLLYDLDVRHKNRVRLFFLREKIKNLKKSHSD